MTIRTIAILIVVSLVGLGAFLFIISGESNDSSLDTSTSQTTQQDNDSPDIQEESSQSIKQYEASEVASHNTAEDCWTIINSSVYDISSYVPRHPGGDEILRACGADATSMFESRETASGEEIGSGEPHSPSAEQQLAQLKIGTLAQ